MREREGGKSRFTRLLSTRVVDVETGGPQQDSAGGDVYNPQSTPVFPRSRGHGGERQYQRAVIDGGFGRRKRNHQLQATRHACAPGYRRGSDLARNVQTSSTGPMDGPQRQKEEAGAAVDRGKVSSLLRVHDALSLASSQAGRTHKRSAESS